MVSPAISEEPIMGGDRLVFAGQIDEILDLKETHGFVNADHHVFTMSEIDRDRQLRTAYVTFGSSLINKKIGGSSFEKDNNMILVAVARRGKRIEESPHDVILQAGDTLLLECLPRVNIHTDRLASQLQFFDSAQVPNIGKKTLISTTIMIAMVVLSALNVIPLLQCAFLAAIAMLLFRCCNVDHVLPHHVRGRREVGLRTLPVLHRPDGQRQQ
jgi:hypothetical protein